MSDTGMSLANIYVYWLEYLGFSSVTFYALQITVSLLYQYELMFRPNVAIIRFTYMYEAIALFWLC
jgi:hypothetical protein